MDKRRCLVADVMHESLFPMLKEIGWEADYQPSISRAQLKAIHEEYDGIILRSKTFVDRDLLGEHPKVRFIGRAGAGLDNLDLEYLAEKGIHVLQASEGNRDAVGEYAIGTLLSLMRNISKADAQVKSAYWDREANRGEEIMGKTIGIIGYGNMGQAVAKRLAGFQCNVIAYDKYKSDFSDQYCKEVSMETIVTETDILSLHVPLTVETKAMVNKEYLMRFRRKIILINTARGEIVALSDLSQLMVDGRVRGAVLDVLENEKLDTLTPGQMVAFNSLRKMSNVIFTPHIAGWTFESHVKINVALVQKLKSLELV
jgi:D-3-phosphoglycerate dehydrogenase